jgi:hypothetical protein
MKIDAGKTVRHSKVFKDDEIAVAQDNVMKNSIILPDFNASLMLSNFISISPMANVYKTTFYRADRLLTLLLCMVFSLPFSSASAQAVVDYRPWQSPVRNQEGRGTCTAFAIATILETLPGFPTDVSEQHIYAWAKLRYFKEMPKTYMEGGSLAFYQELLRKQGAVPEFKYPYVSSSPIFKEDDDNWTKLEKDIAESFYKLFDFQRFSYKVQTRYLQDEEAQDIAFIKELLDKGKKAVAVCYRINGIHWSQKNSPQNNTISPWDVLQVKQNGKLLSDFDRLVSFSDWIKLFYEEKVELIFKNPDLKIDGGHAVAIVGYGKEGFLIKNSWGPDWGDKGYAWISYDYHRLFARELLFVTDYEAAGRKDDESIRYTADDIQLKSLPHASTDYFSKKKSNCISLSVVYNGNASPPRFSSIIYRIYDSDDKLIDTQYGNTQGIFDGFLSGYETYLGCVEQPFKRTFSKLVAEFTLLNGEKIIQTYRQISGDNKQYVPVVN